MTAKEGECAHSPVLRARCRQTGSSPDWAIRIGTGLGLWFVMDFLQIAALAAKPPQDERTIATILLRSRKARSLRRHLKGVSASRANHFLEILPADSSASLGVGMTTIKYC